MSKNQKTVNEMQPYDWIPCSYLSDIDQSRRLTTEKTAEAIVNLEIIILNCCSLNNTVEFKRLKAIFAKDSEHCKCFLQ